VTAIWPPTGLALTAVLIWGRRMWPAVALGAFVANITTPIPLGSALGITTGNTLEALAGAYLLTRVGFRPSLGRVRDVVALVLLGAGLSTMVSASIGVFSLWAGGEVSAHAIPTTWRVWWLGDAGGDLVVAPALLVLAARQLPQLRRAWVGEAVGLATALTLASVLITRQDSPFGYVIFPLLFWTALRFRQPGAVVAGVLVSGITVFYTARGQGPFAGGSPDADLLRAQIFAGVATATALLVAAVATAQAAAAAEQRYRSLVDRMPAVVYEAEVGEAGRWLFVSPQIEDLLGYSPEEWRADPTLWSARIHRADRDSVLRNEAEQTTGIEEYRLLHRDGHPVWVRDEATIERRPDGAPYWRGLLIDITDRKAAEDQLEYQALHDPLTGLPNRVLFLDRLEHALTRARRSRTRLAVLFCDLDDFKRVNDSLGHESGDVLLAALTPRLRRALRAGDTVARFGGDEFVVICEDIAGEPEAVTVAGRIAGVLRRPFVLDGRELFITVSIGVVIVEDGSASATEMLRDADAAMYRAKQSGPGRYEIFDQQMRSGALDRIRIETDLRQAVEKGELRLVFQPVISLEDDTIVGAEALARWQHPEQELLPPADFIPHAEESGVILLVGKWALEQACRKCSQWHELLPNRDPIRVSVNLSARQVAQPGLADSVAQILRDTGLQAGSLELEITESVLMKEAPMLPETLHALKALGVRLVLDDFGTGYSSLSHLKQFPIDALKIDRSFVDGLPYEAEDAAIVAAVLGMAQALEMTVIAEGVETEAQLAFLREHGCQLAQGYYFAGPLSAGALVNMLRESEPGVRRAPSPSQRRA
jgi:diguanylate cyclase (GGDEF)-like protein/PAS domain S-box-containing protein